MKVIFIDYEGVLNCRYTKESIQGCIGFDDKRLDYLKEIVDATEAKLVCTSDWRTKEQAFIDYAHKKLAEHGMEIYDNTPDLGEGGLYRGKEIRKWLSEHEDVEDFIIIDDENFDVSYEKLGAKWIQTQYFKGDGGIQPKHVKRAIKMLNGNKKEKEND